VDWKQAIQGFQSYMLLELNLSEHSIDAYSRDLQKLVNFLDLHKFPHLPLDLDTETLRQFIWWLNDLGLGARSQARLISGLKTFFKYLLMEELIQTNPADILDAPKLSRKIPEVLGFEEIQQMLSAIDLSTNQGVRNRAMLETLYACGLRVSELVNLQHSNVMLDVGYVKVIGKGNKERIVPIGEEAIKHIRFYQEGVRRAMMNIDPKHKHFLFLNRRGKQLTRVYVFTLVKDLAKQVGIKKKVSPHTFRHSFATHLIEGGANLKAVQDMLGHESILTTEIYTHLDTDYLRATIMQFHPQNRKP